MSIATHMAMTRTQSNVLVLCHRRQKTIQTKTLDEQAALSEFDLFRLLAPLRSFSKCRPVDNDVLISPCDAIVGAHGPIDGTTVYQIKGYPYDLGELIPDSILQSYFRDGIFITLRLKSSMYHHFHAPADGTLRHITYCSGDTWNVNPIALQCVQKLFCKNERALLEYELSHNRDVIALVPVAAILVASLKLQCLGSSLNMNYTGQTRMACLHSYRRGDRLGHFEHGSTIICLAPAGYSVCSSVTENSRINMGEALLRRDQ